MRAAEALLVIAVVLGGGVVGSVHLIRWSTRRHALRNAPWELAEHSDGELVSLQAERPGEDALLVGAVAFARDDFDSAIEVARSEARAKVVALNSGRLR